MTPGEGSGELHPDLLLLVRREHVDDTVDRLGSVLGVQRPEDKVAGFSSGQRSRDRLEVTHLTHEDDVGVLTQHVLRSASAKLCVSVPTSRWLTMQLYDDGGTRSGPRPS